MSALLIPSCGRPGAVSSIFTAIVGRLGTGPMPVNGFAATGSGAGLGRLDDEDDEDEGRAGGGAELVGSEPPLLVHPALASNTLATIDGATTWRRRVIFRPLPGFGAGRRPAAGRPPRRGGRTPCRRCRRPGAWAAGRPSGTGAACGGCAAPSCHGPHRCRSAWRSSPG